MSTDKSFTLDMLDDLQDDRIKFGVLVQYLKQVGIEVSRMKAHQETCPADMLARLHELDTRLQELNYHFQGPDGNNGLKSKVMEQRDDIKIIRQKLEALEDQLQALVIKATIFLGAAAAFGIPLVNRLLSKIFP